MSTFWNIELDGKPFKLQFGHGIRDESASVPMRLIQTKLKGELVFTVDCPRDSTLFANLTELEHAVGAFLFSNLSNVYKGNQIMPSFLDRDNFMSCKSKLIVHDEKYGQDQLYVRVRAKSQCYLIEGGADGSPFSRAPLDPDFSVSNFIDYRGTMSMRVTVSTSMISGVPRWGLMVILYDAYCLPTTKTVSVEQGCVFEDASDVFVDIDASSALPPTPPRLKRSEALATAPFIEPRPKKLKRIQPTPAEEDEEAEFDMD